MKVDLVSRNLGRHKGEAAILLCDAEMVNRAFNAVKAIAASLNINGQSLSANHENAVSVIVDTIMNNMESPAIDLLSDFRDSYTAPRNRIVEIHLSDTTSTRVLGIIPSLSREGSATVRVSKIDVKAIDKNK
ncbi:hypothetical protein D3C80_993110 [compost metagenome]